MAKHRGKKGAHPRASERRETAAEVQEQLETNAPAAETRQEREVKAMWGWYDTALRS